MKNVVNTMDREGRSYTFPQQRFPQKSLEEIKAGIFDEPLIWVLMKGLMFSDRLSGTEMSPWWFIKSVISNFVGNKQNAEN